jgi:hypothetical protein
METMLTRGTEGREVEDYSGWPLRDRLELLAFDARLGGVPATLLEALWEVIDRLPNREIAAHEPIDVGRRNRRNTRLACPGRSGPGGGAPEGLFGGPYFAPAEPLAPFTPTECAYANHGAPPGPSAGSLRTRRID